MHSGITFIRHDQNGKIRKPNNLKFWGQYKPKDLNRMAKIGLGHLKGTCVGTVH